MIELQMQASPFWGIHLDSEPLGQAEQKLLVLQTGIAGLQYYVDKNSEEGKALLASLTPGTELKLFRDPDNEHDKWAISVYTTDDRKIGYIARFKGETIARLMDCGKRFSAVVDEPPPEPANETEYRRTRTWTENYKVPFSVYLENEL